MDRPDWLSVTTFLAFLLLVMGLTWRDPLFRTPQGRPDRRMATLAWPGLFVVVTILRATTFAELEMPTLLWAGAALYATLCLATLGRPAIVMDGLFRSRATYPDFTKKLLWRGRIAVTAALMVVSVMLLLTLR